jgi:protein-disulfide isomerase
MKFVRSFTGRTAWTVGFLSIVLAAGASCGFAQSTDMARPGAAAAGKSAIEDIIRQYIMDHGEILIQAVNEYQAREHAATLEKNKKAVAGHANEFASDKTSPARESAKPGPAVTIVEFFDYNCHYCKKVEPLVNQMLAENPGARMVYKDYPILGDSSELAARAALAARKQGAYDLFHQGLMMSSEKISMATIETLGTQLSLDVDKLKADMNSKEIGDAILHNRELAIALGVTGTPGIIVGSEISYGDLDARSFQGLIDKAKGTTDGSIVSPQRASKSE